MTAMSRLTGVQEEAVRATAALLLRDPDELAEEFYPLIFIVPETHQIPPEPEPEAPKTTTVTWGTRLEPDSPVWGLGGATEKGLQVVFPGVAGGEFTVKDPLTPDICDKEPTP